MWDSVHFVLNQLGKLFIPFGSGFGLSSLAVALFICAGMLIARRARRGRSLKLSTMMRGLFPGWMMRHESHHADIAYFAFSVFAYGLIFGWAILSNKFWSNLVVDGLNGAFGAPTPTSWPDFAARATITLVLFLAYEFGYWLDHYLKHKVPALWELHKVHHSANVLTPLTVFRIHPLDAVIFSNILGVCLGVANGVSTYAFGKTTTAFTIDDTNILLVIFIHVYVHLQHAHVDPIHGHLGPHLPEPGASPDPSLQQPDALRQESRKLPRDLGLAVRHAPYPEEGAGEPELRRDAGRGRHAEPRGAFHRAGEARGRASGGAAEG